MLDQHVALASDFGLPSPLATCPNLTAYEARFAALSELAGYFSGPLHALPMNNKAALWGGEGGTREAEHVGGFVGLEEVFLKVKDLDASVHFYHELLGIPLERTDEWQAYLQCEGSHVVLQRDRPENGESAHQIAAGCSVAEF